MKKILLLLAVMFFGNAAFAFGEIDRKVALNTSIDEVQNVVIDVIKSFDGAITVKEMNKNEHRFVVSYNGTTLLSPLVGTENMKWASDKYAKAFFSCKLTPLNNGKDVLIVCRKHTTRSLFFSHCVLRHYKKIYHELKLKDIELVKYKEYKKANKI